MHRKAGEAWQRGTTAHAPLQTRGESDGTPPMYRPQPGISDSDTKDQLAFLELPLLTVLTARSLVGL